MPRPGVVVLWPFHNTETIHHLVFCGFLLRFLCHLIGSSSSGRGEAFKLRRGHRNEHRAADVSRDTSILHSTQRGDWLKYLNGFN